MGEKQYPGSAVTERGANQSSLATAEYSARPSKPLERGVYCAHVADDGTEYRIEGHADLRTSFVLTKLGRRVHEVRILELPDGTLVDETSIHTIQSWFGGGGTIIMPRAHGVGWTIFDSDSSDNYTAWRRPHVPQDNLSPNEFRRRGAP